MLAVEAGDADEYLMSAGFELGWGALYRDPKALGKKYREKREIEVAPAPASEADS